MEGFFFHIFILLFKFSCLHFPPPTTPPTPAISTSKMEGFIGKKKSGAGELLTKEKKGLFLDQNNFGRKGTWKGFLCRLPLLSMGWGVGVERLPMTDCLIGIDQKIPDWFTKTTFPGEVETEVGSGFKSRFDIMGF